MNSLSEINIQEAWSRIEAFIDSNMTTAYVTVKVKEALYLMKSPQNICNRSYDMKMPDNLSSLQPEDEIVIDIIGLSGKLGEAIGKIHSDLHNIAIDMFEVSGRQDMIKKKLNLMNYNDVIFIDECPTKCSTHLLLFGRNNSKYQSVVSMLLVSVLTTNIVYI